MNSVLFFFSCLMVAQALVSIRDGRRNARYAETYPHKFHAGTGTVPNVRIFCPIRGTPAGLEANLRSLVDQDHPRFHVTFIVESREDPAHAVAARLGAGGAADVVIAGPATRSGQKVHNLTVAVERFGADADVWVFADADARFPPHWLGELTAPLVSGSDRPEERPVIGATTGYRWYVAPADRHEVSPGGGYWASSFRSAWNASVLGFLGPGSKNFAWGGSMAIRRDVFDRIGVAACWEGALSDDFQLTAAVGAANLRIVYVPTCLVPSYGTCRWSDLWEFSTRQMKITRVYAPAVWRMALVSYTLFTGTLLALTLSLGSGPLPALFWLTLVGMAAYRGNNRLAAARRTISHPSIQTRRWFYCLASPLIAFLFLGNIAAAIWSRKIVWKGITYRMNAPNDTVVLGRDPYS